MEAEAALVAMLTAAVPVTAIMGNRIGQAGMPQGMARPNVVYQRLGTSRSYHNQGSDKAPKAMFQISCYADSTATARSLASAVRSTLDGFKGTVGTVGALKIDAIFLTDERDAPQPPATGSGQSVKGVQFDCSIHFQE